MTRPTNEIRAALRKIRKAAQLNAGHVGERLHDLHALLGDSNLTPADLTDDDFTAAGIRDIMLRGTICEFDDRREQHSSGSLELSFKTRP